VTDEELTIIEKARMGLSGLKELFDKMTTQQKAESVIDILNPFVPSTEALKRMKERLGEAVE
jgi:hypothetical protein